MRSSPPEAQSLYLADFSLALVNRTGAYYACRDVVQRLPQFFQAVRYWRLILKREPPELISKLLGRAMLFELRHRKFFNALPGFAGRPSIDAPTLYFDPLYVLDAGLQARDIVLCHDIGPVSHPELFNHITTAMYVEAYDAIRAAKPGMVFVSEASRAAFKSRFGEDYRFLEVIPLYVRSALTAGEETAPAGVQPPFILTVGSLEPRKNHARTIAAFEESGLRKQGYTYVICGARGHLARDISALVDATPGVHILGYLSDSELRWLYRHAAAFVLPSLLEGFGLPGLEAAQQGLLPVVGWEAAQKEAVGDGGILVDPLSVEAIARGITQAVTMSDAERQERLALLHKHADSLSQTRYLARWAALLASASNVN